LGDLQIVLIYFFLCRNETVPILALGSDSMGGGGGQIRTQI